MLYDLNNVEVGNPIILSGKLYEFYEFSTEQKEYIKQLIMSIGESDDIVEKWSVIINLCLWEYNELAEDKKWSMEDIQVFINFITWELKDAGQSDTQV